MNINVNEDRFKLKENGKQACKQCGSFKFTQTISDKVGVICKECLGNIFDRAIDDIMGKIEAKND